MSAVFLSLMMTAFFTGIFLGVSMLVLMCAHVSTVWAAAAVIQRESQTAHDTESKQLQHRRHQEGHQLHGGRKRSTHQESRSTQTQGRYLLRFYDKRQNNLSIISDHCFDDEMFRLWSSFFICLSAYCLEYVYPFHMCF